MTDYQEHLTPEVALAILNRRIAGVVGEAYDNQCVMQTHLALGNTNEAAEFAQRIEHCNIALTALVAERSRWEGTPDGDDEGSGSED